jgi:hypothetical protein
MLARRGTRIDRREAAAVWFCAQIKLKLEISAWVRFYRKGSGTAMRRIFLSMLLAASLAGALKAQEMTGKTADAVKKEMVDWENTKVKMLLSSSSVAADWYEHTTSNDIAYTLTDGTMRTKAQLVAEFRSGETKMRAINHHDYHVRVYGTGNIPHTAVVTYIGDEITEAKGKSSHTYDRATDVLIMEGGEWRRAVHHETSVPNPGA